MIVSRFRKGRAFEREIRPAHIPFRRETDVTLIRLMVVYITLFALAGCATVRIDDADPRAAFAERRGDYLTTGVFSVETRSVLFLLGSEAPRCERSPSDCISLLYQVGDQDTESILAVLSELSLAKALRTEQAARGTDSDEVIADYLNAARFAYAFLFLDARPPEERALENRQTRVRDYYNFSVERVATLVFQRTRRADAPVMPVEGTVRDIGQWSLTIGRVEPRLQRGTERLASIVSPTRLQIRGLQNAYRRDGLGGELVAVWTPDVSGQHDLPMRDIGFSPATVLLEFEGEGLDQVLSRREARLLILDPNRSRTTWVRGQHVPVAANFSASYALWLSRAGFRRQGLLSTLGRDTSLMHPRIHLMQPYDPDRFTVIMLHGLASSPEAWANLANEVLGDATLRDHFQIWQVHYPTNLPIAINHLEIRYALERTLAAVDARGQARAGRDMILIGHSMGGVIARLLILEGSEDIWMETLGVPEDSDRRAALAPLEPYIRFEPLEGVSRSVFLASPHAGTPFAGNWLSRFVTRLVRLPADVILRIAAVAEAIAQDLPESAERLRGTPTSIHQLDAANPFLQATSRLGIAPGIDYHSIIARNDPSDPPENSSDGVVPFASAYLPGAASTLLVNAGHSVQQTPEAIVEIRRILHLHLVEHGLIKPPEVRHLHLEGPERGPRPTRDPDTGIPVR
ncbi:esterase/lipase family protein [Ectothiorhodospira shaposhnikovii]|uniref:esterase/lipase family protein n=1 Tax=Ectothiorhodospira shaposhnikovii TaxID=1054 RepID=UPI0039A27C8D